MYLLLFISLIGSLTACVKVTDIENEPPPTASAVSMPAAQAIAGDKANQYQVSLPITDGVQVFHRTELNLETKIGIKIEVLPLLREGNSFIDQTAVAGRLYLYELGYMANGQFQLLARYDMKVPIDLVVAEPIELSEHTHWNQYSRIFLQSLVTTNGFEFSIKAKSLISEGGSIQTFPRDLRAALGKRGRHGGKILMELESARGDLNVWLRGENGGDGADGKAYETVPSGLGYCDNSFDPNGAKGRRGENGFRGGDTGELSLKFSQSHTLNARVFKEVGLGGNGGAGGPGQPGGTHGIYRSDRFGTRCEVTLTGKEGAPGLPGQVGGSGEAQKFCLKDPSGERCD